MTDPLLGEDDDGYRVVPQNKQTQEEALSFCRALLLPGVLLVSLKYDGIFNGTILEHEIFRLIF